MKTVLNVSTNASVTLSKVETKTDKTEDKSGKKEDVKDTIDLGVGLDVAERLRNAKDTDDLVSLLKEGQDQARANIAKFKALQQERLYGKSEGSYQEAADRLFEAVRKTVVDVLSEQGDSGEKTVYSSLSFEMRLSIHLKEGGDDVSSPKAKEPG